MRLCLVGRGIAASPSPALHNALLAAAGIPGTYSLCDVDGDQLAELARRLRAGELDGCNVTTPYKREFASRCERLEGDARLLGVVNTVRVDHAGLVGDNTDATGFQRALEHLDAAPAAGGDGIVLGGGGAALAVCLALQRLGLRRISVVARRPAAVHRTEALAGIAMVAWEPAAVRPLLGGCAIAVNASPVGISLLPFHPRQLPASCTVADVRYLPSDRDVVDAARETGHTGIDGREMLVQQALASFQLWTGIQADAGIARAAVVQALR